jgi:hypothetical protein
MLLPRFGPRPIVPIGLLVSATAMFELHWSGCVLSYVGHLRPAAAQLPNGEVGRGVCRKCRHRAGSIAPTVGRERVTCGLEPRSAWPQPGSDGHEASSAPAGRR